MPLLTTAELDNISAKSYKAKVIKIPDPLKFYGKPAIDLILYKDWLLQIKNRLRTNNSYISIILFKMLYIQHCMTNNALVQISTQIGNNATWPFTIAKKMLDVLTAGLNNPDEKNARLAYKSLRQSARKFGCF